jgi:type II restriction/modification system DNA methylase subunit YeeA
VNTRALPLHNITQIVCGNACRLDWNTVCPHGKDEEVFVFGNPPYLGSKLQDNTQKEDVAKIFGKLKNCKILDYISNWFESASCYINETSATYAFVSTNSICQGEQVSVLWPPILKRNQEIQFAYTSFKWTNNAKYNAGVTVVIIGVGNNNNNKKKIYNENSFTECSYINPYLSVNSKTIVFKSTQTPKGLPRICFGSMPYDDGHLLFNYAEYQNFISNYPNDSHFLHRIYGSQEFINDIPRYCLWIDDNEVETAKLNPIINERVVATRKERLKSPDESGRKLAEKPYQFREHPDLSEAIIIPAVSSERRKYIPMGYLDKGTVISNSAFAIYDAEMWLFGILTSKMHMAWVRTVGGKLKTDYRYSAQLCYNTFPFPKISEEKKKRISEAAEEVLLARADYPEKTLAEMYDPDKMPQNLREAHNALDDVVDSCYSGYPFANDEARLECLFKLYEKMTAKTSE